MLIVNHNDVAKLLPMRECIDVMRDALKQLAKGNVILPLRQVVRLPERKGLLGLMPAYMGAPPSAGIKVLTIFPENHGTKFDAHQGAVLLFEVEHGCLAAVMDATAITAIRTAAVSAVATALLARRDASVLAILGSGGQARTHFEAMRSVRQLSGVRVWSRSAERREAFAKSESGKDDVPVEVAASAEAAVRGADIICTVTSSHDVVLRGDWIAAGAHINAVGAGLPTARELDSLAVAKSRLFVDRRESAFAESGDFLLARSEGAIADDHIVAEIGEVLVGKADGRRAENEVTLFKSLGLAVEDLAAAEHIYRKARRLGAGATVDFGGTRHAIP